MRWLRYATQHARAGEQQQPRTSKALMVPKRAYTRLCTMGFTSRYCSQFSEVTQSYCGATQKETHKGLHEGPQLTECQHRWL